MTYPDALAAVIDSFKNLCMPSPMPLLVTMGAIAGSRFEGMPVHLFLIGSPSSGKNVVLESLFSLPKTIHVSTFSEAAMLSAWGSRDRAKNATGGYLKQLGGDGIMILTEFNSVLRMSPDKRGSALGALQNVCTGLLDRGSGADGGEAFHWDGKIQVLAGGTEHIEDHRALMGQLGERFVYCKFPVLDRRGHLKAAMLNSRNGMMLESKRRQLRSMTDFFARLEIPAYAGSLVDESDEESICAVADMVTLARSTVVRDERSKEVTMVHDAEGPARAALMFQRLLCGMRVIGVPKNESLNYLAQVALGSIPKVRRILLQIIASGEGSTTVNEILEKSIGYKHAVVRRGLEELEIHGVVKRSGGHENYWELTEEAQENWYLGFGGIE